MLELKNISLDLENGRKILNDVSLTIDDGKFVVITGPNGGGKSTLAKIISGIQTPTAGQILFNGTDITQATITERARMGISFAFQQPVRFKGIKVRDLITLAAGKTLTTNGVCSYLSEVGLCARDYVDREINASLSGGEIKRIEIAMTMARSAPLSIFDEPEAGIDLWSFQKLIEIFQKMHTEIRGSSIIIISHQERILNIADKIIVLSEGKIIQQGNKDAILPGLLNGTDACRFCPKQEGVQ